MTVQDDSRPRAGVSPERGSQPPTLAPHPRSRMFEGEVPTALSIRRKLEFRAGVTTTAGRAPGMPVPGSTKQPGDARHLTSQADAPLRGELESLAANGPGGCPS